MRTVKCRLCYENIPVGNGLEAMEEHWRRRHPRGLEGLKRRAAEDTEGKMPHIDTEESER